MCPVDVDRHTATERDTNRRAATMGTGRYAVDIHFQQQGRTPGCKPSFREHGTFWLTFLAVVVAGLVVAGAAFATFGLAAAAFILCLELTTALAVGIL